MQDDKTVVPLPNAQLSKPVDKNIVVGSTANLIQEVTDKISEMTLIDKTDIVLLQEAQKFLLETYMDVPQFRPMVKKVTSVLTDGNFPTVDSKYWQCKVEAEVHFNELSRGMLKYERALIDIEEIDYKIKSIDDMLFNDAPTKEKFDPELIKFDKARLVIKRKEYLFELKQLEKTLKYRIEEVTDWYKISERLKPDMKSKTYDEHVVEAHFRKLENNVKGAMESGDASRIHSAHDQLNTFKRLLMSAKEEEKK